jgi:hypothetical protein
MTFKEAVTGDIPVMTDRKIRESFEVVAVNQRKGIWKIGKMDGAAFMWMGMPWTGFDDLPVYDWTHTDKTMLIIL